MPTDKKEKPYCKECVHNCWTAEADGSHVKKCDIKKKAIADIKKDEMRKCADFKRS